MPPRLNLCIWTCLLWLVWLANPSFAADFDLLAQSRAGDGGQYLSWWKLLTVVLTFLLWVWMSDWLNRDTQKLGEDTGLKPEVWNPLNLAFFLIGFFCAISVPMFFVGYPIMAVLGLGTPSLYWLIRRGKLSADEDLKIKAKTPVGVKPKMRALPQDEGADIKFTPAGNEAEKQANLIRARQAPNFLQLKDIIRDCIQNRTEVLLMDYTQAAANGRTQIDGMWHPLPAMDRETADSLLVSLKCLAGLNPLDRRNLQKGLFKAKADVGSASMELTTQGTATGERVILKFDKKDEQILKPGQLGMLPDSVERVKSIIDKPGLIIVSAPPQAGLTTSWRGILGHMDRITRDCIGLLDVTDDESDIENITPHRFDASAGETPLNGIRKILLTQPDGLVVRDIANGEVLDTLVEQANEQDRTVVTQIKARSASEALLRLYAMSEKRAEFEQAVKLVTGQRLLRRLCDKCKVAVQVQPQLIQQLGGNPKKQNTIYQPYKLPPPEQQVDENGKPIEMKPCETCSGIGYIGRVAAFEVLVVGDRVRQALRVSPKVDAVEKAALSEGKRTLIAEGYRLVLLGITSIAEVQRVMQNK